MTQSDQDQFPKYTIKIDDINIYPLIPQAKPIISSNIFLQDSSLTQVLQERTSMREDKKVVFKKQQTIEKGYNFSSNYESGNIQQVNQIQTGVYLLKIKSDTNSKLQSQWFYFKIKGVKKATFIIEGFRKSKSLYNEGMKICIKEDKWIRGGKNITYFKDDSYCLKFQYKFKNPNKICQIAYSFPYTYSDLCKYIDNIITNKNYKYLIKKQIICKTILNNQIICLTFGSSKIKKPVIFITSRVHPGQTVSSFILKGIIDSLLENQITVKALLKFYEIKIIPMLNPDGVKLGNYRFNYTGRDLNRCWKNPHQKISSEIFFTRQYISKFHKRISMIIDLHGHSRKKDVFFYGCAKSQQDLTVRKFPYLMQKLSNNFSYKKSCFNIQNQKQGTARIHLWKLIKIPYIYTLQCSFCGKSTEDKNFQINDLIKIGNQLIHGIGVFFSQNYKYQHPQIFEKYNSAMQNFIKDKNIFANDEDRSGSQSNPSQGILQQKQIIQFLQNNYSKKQAFRNRYQFNNKSLVKTEQKYQNQSKQIRPASHNFRKRMSTTTKSTRINNNMNYVLKNLNQIMKSQQNDDSSLSQYSRGHSKVINTLSINERQGKVETNMVDNEFLTMYNYKQKKKKSIKLFLSNLKNENGIEDDMQKLKYFGPQYTRVRNYAKKLRMQNQKIKNKVDFELQSQINNGNRFVGNDKIKLCVKSIKIVNPLNIRNNIFNKKVNKQIFN